MEPLAIVAMQLISQEARSALPDAPVVEDRPSLFSRMVGGVAAARRGLAGRGLKEPASVPSRREVRRAA